MGTGEGREFARSIAVCKNMVAFALMRGCVKKETVWQRGPPKVMKLNSMSCAASFGVPND